jgi:uncharacterized protein involved in cysteine biosynthesis
MLGLFFRSFSELLQPEARSLLLRSLLWSVVVLAILCIGIWVFLGTTRLFEEGWLENTADAAGGLGAVVLAYLLFPAVIGLVSSLFLDEIADKVEARHYPDAKGTRQISVKENLVVAARFTGLLLLANLIVLPVYLVLLFFPPGLIAFSALVNGYLMGREYFELVALRHMDPAATRAAYKRNRNRLSIAGAVIAVMLGIPVVNLLAPIVATGFMVHLFADMRRRGAV